MPSNQELERICNVAGYPIYPWAADQLKVRSEKGSQETRDNDNLLYLANKNAWVRVPNDEKEDPSEPDYWYYNEISKKSQWDPPYEGAGGKKNKTRKRHMKCKHKCTNKTR